MNRNDVTEKIITAKVSRGITWASVAVAVGASKEWVTAACLGQMRMSEAQAVIVRDIFGLDDEERKWLQVSPAKGAVASSVPNDPLIYRFYEIASVYGPMLKELIHEEFGEGIMSAIDFTTEVTREVDPHGDRVRVVLSGKFLAYKEY